jgi:hypothetical protein
MRFRRSARFATLAATAALAAALPVRPATARDPSPDPAHTTIVTGRLLDADGKPIAGGNVVLVAESWSRSERPLGSCYVDFNDLPLTFRVTGPFPSDHEGRFRAESPSGPARPGLRLLALGAAAGQGQATVEVAKGSSVQSLDLKLDREHIIRGRLIDTQGQPAAGATVRPIMLTGRGTTLQTLVPTDPIPPYASPLAPAVTTDDKGRFVIRGLGKAEVWLEVTHKGFATQRLHVRPTPAGNAMDTPFSLVSARVVQGRVTYGQGGKPAAGARVVAFVGNGNAVECRTDDDGRYSLNPFPSASVYHMVFPPDGQPYLTTRRDESFSDAKYVESDIALERGVMVRGRVLESPSGKPVVGALLIYRQRTANNPFPHQDVRLWDWSCCHVACQSAVSGADGAFQVVVPPGPGHLFVVGPTHDYVHMDTSAGELEYGHPGMIRYHPDGLISLDVKPGTEPPAVTATLRRGVTLRARVQGAGGKPAETFIALSRSYIPTGYLLWEWGPGNLNHLLCRNGELILPGCDPEKGGTVWLFDAAHALGATLNFTGAEASGPPMTVALLPCGTASIRNVDAEGRPLSPVLSIVFSPGAIGTLIGRVDAKDGKPLEGDWHMWSTYDKVPSKSAEPDAKEPEDRPPVARPLPPAEPDTTERVTFRHLIPGATYQVSKFFDDGDGDQGWPKVEFQVKPGVTLTLPDFDRGSKRWKAGAGRAKP